MRPIHHLVIVGLAPVLANCSTHPLVDDVTRATTPDIVKHIRCEAKRAINDYDRRSRNASANTTMAIAYEFTFTITENNNARGNITGNLPFLNSGNFSLSANAGSERQRFSDRHFKIVENFDDLRRADCSQETLEKNLIYPIAGEIGIYEVVTTFANLQTIANKTAHRPTTLPAPDFPTGDLSGPFRFADNLSFTTTFNGGVNPSLSLSPVTTNSFRVTGVNTPEGEASLPLSPSFDPSGTGLQAKRMDVHQVVVAMAAVPTPTDQHRRNAGIAAPLSPNSILSTTALQLEATAKERALFELDRQRMLALQQRSPNLLVGGP
jgi:hypothetical protein